MVTEPHQIHLTNISMLYYQNSTHSYIIKLIEIIIYLIGANISGFLFLRDCSQASATLDTKIVSLSVTLSGAVRSNTQLIK